MICYQVQTNLRSYMEQLKLVNLIHVNDVTVDSLKFRPIIPQTGSNMYKTAQVVSEYLKPLYENDFTIKNTQDFAQLTREQPPFEEMRIMYLMMSSRYLQKFQFTTPSIIF